MPRTRSLAWSQLKIGLATIAALALAATLIFTLSGAGGFSWQRYTLKTVFPNVSGLNEGSLVRIAGVAVGSVKKVELVGDKVEVEFEISKDFQSRVTTESRAGLGSVSLLGESAVDITPSTQGTPVPEFGYIPAGKAPGSIAEMATSATAGLEQATQLLTDIRAGRGTVGKLFTDEALYNEINQFVAAAEDVASKVNQGRGSVGRLLSNDAAARSLEASMANLEAVTGKIRAGEGSLGKLLNDEALSRSVTSTTANLDAITGRLNRGEGTMGQLMTNDQLFTRLNSMADRLDKSMAALQTGQGSAGLLLHDKQLYENMNGAVAEVRNLLKNIQADPRKYLNVRVSLF